MKGIKTVPMRVPVELIPVIQRVLDLYRAEHERVQAEAIEQALPGMVENVERQLVEHLHLGKEDDA